jgi:hypothetical protein
MWDMSWEIFIRGEKTKKNLPKSTQNTQGFLIWFDFLC